MQDPARVGLGRLPSIETAIASPILAPDARCPRPQCRVTNELLCKAYDTAARELPLPSDTGCLYLSAAGSG